MGRIKIFSDAERKDIIEKLELLDCNYDHDRDELLSGLEELRSKKLINKSSPGSQLFSDLKILNRCIKLKNGIIPVARFLDNAAYKFSDYEKVPEAFSDYSNIAKKRYEKQKRKLSFSILKLPKWRNLLKKHPALADTNSPLILNKNQETVVSLLNRQENYNQIRAHFRNVRNNNCLQKPSVFIIPASDLDNWGLFFSRMVRLELPFFAQELGIIDDAEDSLIIEPIIYKKSIKGLENIEDILDCIADTLPDIPYSSKDFPDFEDLTPLMAKLPTFSLCCRISDDKWDQILFNRWIEYMCYDWPENHNDAFITFFLFIETHHEGDAKEIYNKIISSVNQLSELRSNVSLIDPLKDIEPGHLVDWMENIKRKCPNLVPDIVSIEEKTIHHAQNILFPDGTEKRPLQEIYDDIVHLTTNIITSDKRVIK